MKKFFLKRNKQRQSLICLKNCEMNNFLAILELCAFYIEYKKVKFTAINFRGRTNVKYFMQTQVLRFCKDTAKVSSLPLLKITTKSIHFHCVSVSIGSYSVCIFQHSDWIRRDTPYLSLFNLNAGKYGPE